MPTSLQLTNVCFLDAVPKRRVFDYLNQSHVALICTWDHEFQRMVLANKVFDYMAAGCPVVAAARGETEALLERAGCGWSCLRSSPIGWRRCSVILPRCPPEELADARRSGSRIRAAAFSAFRSGRPPPAHVRSGVA